MTVEGGAGGSAAEAKATDAPMAADAAPRTLRERAVHEIRETLLTIAVFVPFWLVFQTFVYELRSIPSESMVPTLEVGDRVAVAKYAYGYDWSSLPFGVGRMIFGDNPDNPKEKIFARLPHRGDVIVFRHPHDTKVMIKRVIGLPGDTIQMINGRLHLNGVEVGRERVREVTYVQDDTRLVRTATEYREQLPGEKKTHLIHEFSDEDPYDNTPVFKVPADHVFMMGDNRDNSEDSRAPSGHRELFAVNPQAWGGGSADGPQAIGYVPVDHLIGRGDTVLFTLHMCKHAPGAECLSSKLWGGL